MRSLAVRVFSIVALVGGRILLPAPLPEDPDVVSGPETEKRFPPLVVPAGFRATLFACDPLIEYPSAMALGPRPGSVFLAHDYLTGLGTEIVRRDEIRLVEDTDGDGYADRSILHATGLNSVMGLAYAAGSLYVMHAPLLTVLRDRDGDGIAEERRDLLSGLGLPPEKNSVRLHCANGVAVGHDGWLYLALGDHGCDVPRPEGDRLVLKGGGILRCRPDGRDLHVLSSGLRNIYDVALDDELNVFVRDNENDGGDYKIRVYHSFHGADHGYPYLYSERPDEALTPLADLGLGSSAGGVCYRERAFAAEYHGNLFFCEWGRSVVRYVPRRGGSSFAPIEEIEFARGAETDPYGFKPTDVIVDRDGSLLVADWADGQRPRRGRGRIYRIQPDGPSRGGAAVRGGARRQTMREWIASLDSESYYQRRAAQNALEKLGSAGAQAVLDALARAELTARGRLHAVWILAHIRGRAATDLLFDLAASDPEAAVRGQAVRALADLHDPVIVERRLDAGPGDPVVVKRFAALATGGPGRVRFEAIVALGRLRWSGAPEWCRRRRFEAPDPALEHAIVQTLRRSGNWAAILELLDGPGPQPPALVSPRTLALRALADRALPVIVDGLIERLGKEANFRRRIDTADALTRVARKRGPAPYWGYRPPPRPPNRETWERTGAIEAALDRALGDTDRRVRVATLGRMQREDIPARLETLAGWLEEEREPATVMAILESLVGRPAREVRALLERVVRDASHATSVRLVAFERLRAGLEENVPRGLLELAERLEDGDVLAAVLRELAKHRLPGRDSLIRRKIESADPAVRAVSLASLSELRVDSTGEPLLRLLRDPDVRVRREAAAAAGRFVVRQAADRLLALSRDDEPSVRQASLVSLRRLGERRALPHALAALRHGVTQLAALEFLGALGGPEHAEVVSRAAGASRSQEFLGAAVHLLADWRQREPPSSPRGIELDRAVARIQGRCGVLFRWHIAGPLLADDAASVVGSVSSPGRPLAEVGGSASWTTLFAAGTDSAVTLDTAGGPGEFWSGFSDVHVPEETTVQFLGSSSVPLEVWLNGVVVQERGARRFRTDAHRFDASLAKGWNRLSVRLAAGESRRFHLRFRRRSSTSERERLAELALAGKGDPERGRTVFFDADSARCFQCHRLGGEGGRIGPELTGAGSRFSRVHLIESILEPGRTVAPGFETTEVVLEGGEVLSGVRIAEDGTTLTLGDSQGEQHVLRKASVLRRRRSEQSIMPEGLEKQLSEREFVDLVAFLEAQKEAAGAVDRGPPRPGRTPLLRAVELDAGDSREVVLSDGRKVTVELLGVTETRDSVRAAVRAARVRVAVNGVEATLTSATYHLPATVAGVAIDCPVTRGYLEDSHIDHWGLEKDARLRLWPAGSPLVRPGSFSYPVKQRWFASLTWMANEPVDGGSRIPSKVYYHAGLDIGGAEGMVDVVAATDGLVVSRGTEALAGYEETPVSPRHDVVYLLDDRGWYYRYSHFQSIDASVRLGERVRRGQKVGVLGKEGASGGWSHLHFEIKSRQPSGRWGTQEGYAFLWEAYRREYAPDLVAVARPYHLVGTGETAVLDGSRSWSADGDIATYEWLLGDGSVTSGPRVERTYLRAGSYSEVLKVTDARGRVDYDFARVVVVDRSRADRFPPYLHAAYYPTAGIRPGDPVTFKVRSFYVQGGRETWDFGDGSPPVHVESDGNVDPHAAHGYATTVHRYSRPGHYLVRVERTGQGGQTATGHLEVRVAP